MKNPIKYEDQAVIDLDSVESIHKYGGAIEFKFDDGVKSYWTIEDDDKRESVYRTIIKQINPKDLT